VLLSARASARAARDRSADVAGAKVEQQKMVRASEKIGEVAGSEWVYQKYPGPPPPKAIYPPDGSTNPPGSGVFDQIFHCTVVQDGRPHTVCVINEAKGGASQLGSRMTKEGIRAGQGSPEYFEDILRSMEGKSGAEATAAATVRQAMADPAQVVKYLHIRANVLEAKGPDNGHAASTEADRATPGTGNQLSRKHQADDRPLGMESNMDCYVGLDASLKKTSVCVVDGTGKVLCEGVVDSQPSAIAKFRKSRAPRRYSDRHRDGTDLNLAHHRAEGTWASGDLHRRSARESGVQDADQQERPL